jgi:predicted DNA-binding transcriptional regulator AlpA
MADKNRRGRNRRAAQRRRDQTVQDRQRPSRRQRTEGKGIVWPSGAALRYGVSGVTVWRWTRDGKLPKRDVFLGGVPVGWKPTTLDAADSGSL